MEDFKNEPWYAVKMIFLHKNRGEYEERILLVRADSFDKAEKKAELDAKEYTQGLDSVEFIEWVDIFHLFGSAVGDKTEVYSKLTSSSLNPRDYIKQMYNM